jgi:plastocyanin
MPSTWRPAITRRGLLALAGAVFIAVPASAAPRIYTVTIQQMAFGPTATGLRVGDIIEWVNNDIFVHSATAKDKSFDIELKPKAHVRMTLKQARTVAFYCRYHPGMMGRLRVLP